MILIYKKGGETSNFKITNTAILITTFKVPQVVENLGNCWTAEYIRPHWQSQQKQVTKKQNKTKIPQETTGDEGLKNLDKLNNNFSLGVIFKLWRQVISLCEISSLAGQQVCRVFFL